MLTITILYPGQMGGAFAALLLAAGHKVISPVGTRSEKTQKLAQEIGIEIRDSMVTAVAESNLILSLVPPSAVVTVAHQTIEACCGQNSKPVFVDLNAKTPADAEHLNGAFSDASLLFCNACIIGRAPYLSEEGRIYASGINTALLEELFKGILPVFQLGDEIGLASVFKMAFAGFNKTVTAALFETANTANALGITESLFELIEYHLSGTLSDLRKLVPTYPYHITRRAEEMEALTKMLADHKLSNQIAQAAGETFRSIGISNSWSEVARSTKFMELLSDINYNVNK